jgi:diguanylate cyclase (GGDEF)-like protein
VTGWAVWRLPPALRWYVTGVVAVAVAAAGAAGARTSWRAHDVVVFAALACFGALAIELTRDVTEPAGLIKTVHGIWQIPMALLLPPAYCLAAPVITFTLIQVRVHRTIVHRQVFSAAASGLSLAAASAIFHAVVIPASRLPLWLLAAVVTALVWLVVNKALVMTAGWLSDRTVSVRDRVFSREPLINDMCEIATGVLLAGALALAWTLAGAAALLLLLPALPLVIILQRAFRHAQLQSAARLDADTGLLNAAAWRAEATVHLAQAQRTGAAVAVALADLDHCRAVNDTYGWQAGDAVLGAVAATLRAGLRPYDLIGRFGDDEFAVLLPGTTAAEALQVGDRLRRSLAAQTTPTGPDHQPLHVTMSMGIAATSDPGSRDLTDLLAAATRALWQAKTAGRDRVCLSADSAGADEPGFAVRQEVEGPASSREDIVAARRELGARLATMRTEAGLTQAELARRAGYSRSAIANAESGQAMSASFWARVDRALGAAGELVAACNRIEASVAAARRQADRQAWMERDEAAGPGVAGAIPEAGGRAVQDSACPRCGLALMVTTQVIATVIPQITEADPGSALPDPFRERPAG